MAEAAVLAAFAGALFLCIGTGISLLPALLFGWCLFFGYGLYRKHTAAEMMRAAFSGVRTVQGILFTFVLIGAITAAWRAAGTIPYIVYHAAALCDPRAMVLATFLLSSLLSFLTGTSVGTAATMGVICVTMARSMDVPLFLAGGAALAGAYFGDRCSPMSTSALLVASVTKTDLYDNLRGMMRTARVPFAASCALYALAGLTCGAHGGASDALRIFEANFSLHPASLLPALVMIALALCRVPVRYAMGLSILCGGLCALLTEHLTLSALFRLLVEGYHPADAAAAALLSGGGVLSMVNTFCIVCISSCYAGMLGRTGLLRGLQKGLLRFSRRASPFGGILLASVVTNFIACNQTLAILLTRQLCEDAEPDRKRMALHLENTAVVVAALVPWSVACAVPLSAMGAPPSVLPATCYLYFLPLWNYFTSYRAWRRAAEK